MEETAIMNVSIPRWKDRARWWGLPIILEWYEIARDKLIGASLAERDIRDRHRL